MKNAQGGGIIHFGTRDAAPMSEQELARRILGREARESQGRRDALLRDLAEKMNREIEELDPPLTPEERAFVFGMLRKEKAS